MPAHFAGVNVSYGASPCFLGARRHTDHSRTDLSRMYLSTGPLLLDIIAAVHAPGTSPILSPEQTCCTREKKEKE